MSSPYFNQQEPRTTSDIKTHDDVNSVVVTSCEVHISVDVTNIVCYLQKQGSNLVMVY